MTASHPSQKHIVEKTSGTAQPLPNRHWPQQVITTLGGREEIVHVAMPEEDKRDATLPRASLLGWQQYPSLVLVLLAAKPMFFGF